MVAYDDRSNVNSRQSACLEPEEDELDSRRAVDGTDDARAVSGIPSNNDESACSSV